MSQEIKIGVNANTGSAERAVSGVEKATENLAAALSKVDKAGKAAAASIGAVEQQAARLKNTQAILEREMGRHVGSSDTESFLRNFDRMRGGRGIGSRRLRDFDNFENWYLGHTGTFKSAADAAAHRRRVFAAGMQGTNYASENGMPPPPAPPGGTPPAGGGGFNNGVQRAQSMAMAFGKSMLALAGLNSIVGMASSAVDMRTEEAVGIDTLKRRLGDVGVSFDKLQDKVRGATDGLGLTYVESARLAQQFAETAGDLRQIDIGEAVKSGVGFSRAYGLDPAQGVQFMATMSRMKVTGGDLRGDKRLALMIGDAVNAGGYSAKADEVVSAVSDFAQQAARMTISTPNVGGFTSFLAGLMGTGYAGLDPSGASAILGAADASVRHGGGMGEAGLNFSYAALRRYSPGIDVVSASGLMSGGLFGTTQGLFGPGSVLGDWYAKAGLKTPALNDVTNLQKMKAQLHASYGNSPYMLDAMKNYFGLQSIEQAAAIDLSNPADIMKSMNLLSASGMKLSNISASGIRGIAAIAGARGMGDLTSIYNTTMGRGDVSDLERGNLQTAFKTGDTEKLRQALVQVVGRHEQEQTDGDKTRQSIADLKNELTRVGGLLLYPLNAIRDGVVTTAMALAPEEYKKRANAQKDAATDYAAMYRARGGESGKVIDREIASITKAYERAKAAAGGKVPNIDDIAPRPNSIIEYTTPGNFQVQMAQRQAVQKMIARDFGASTAEAPQDWLDMMSDTDKLLGLVPGATAKQIRVESGFDQNAVSSAGAMGLAQVMPSTLAALSKRVGRKLDPFDPADAILMNRMLMKENLDRFGNEDDALRAYNAGTDRSKWDNPETNDYINKIHGATPMPEGHAARKSDDSRKVVLGVAGEGTIHLKDQNGKPVGSAKIQPFVSSPAAGIDLAF